MLLRLIISAPLFIFHSKFLISIYRIDHDIIFTNTKQLIVRMMYSRIVIRRSVVK